MGFLDWLIPSFLRRSRVVLPDTPLKAVREMEHLMETQAFDRALRLGEKAMERFPSSEMVPTTYRYVRKRMERDTLRKLRRKLNKGGDPYDYARLGELYLELGDADLAQDVCLRGIEAYAHHEGCFIILGRLRLQRFYEDFIAKDGLKAIEYLEQARNLNRHSYKPPLLLASLYLKVGAAEHAISRCEDIIRFAPGDDRAKQIMQQARQLPELGRVEDLDLLVREYGERMQAAKSQSGQEDNPVLGYLVSQPKRLADVMGIFSRKINGYQSSIAFALDGTLLASHAVVESERDALAANIHRLYRAADGCSLRMDLGGIRQTLFETPTGYLYLFRFESYYFCVVCSPTAKTNQLQEAAEAFVEHEVYLAGIG